MVDSLPAPTQPKPLPVSLSRDEVKAVLLAPRSRKHRVIRATRYATGLRVSALCQLQGTDMDSQRLGSHVRQGQGTRERCVMLSPALLPLLRRSWQL
jgi:integrase/recombinase XerD